jgi:hypothetical protein
MGWGVAHAYGHATAYAFAWPDAMTWAAIVQAVAAVAIGCLTWRLAKLSGESLDRDAKRIERDEKEAGRVTPAFLCAVGMELDALAQQIKSLKKDVSSRPPLAIGVLSPQHTLVLRTTVFSSQLGKLKQVDDPLVLDVIHFYSDLGALEQAVKDTNAASGPYNVSLPHDGTRGKTLPVLAAALEALTKQIETTLARLDELRAKLPAARVSQS